LGWKMREQLHYGTSGLFAGAAKSGMKWGGKELEKWRKGRERSDRNETNYTKHQHLIFLPLFLKQPSSVWRKPDGV